MRDATAVMCISTTANETDNFTVTGDYCTTLVIYLNMQEKVYTFMCMYMGSYMAVSVSTLNY